MGVYDRDYFQEDAPRGFSMFGGPRPIVTNLVVITAAIGLISILTPVVMVDGHKFYWLNYVLSLKVDMYHRPWEFWNLLSYGFVHAGVWHLGINMLVLWSFGRVIETQLGRLEFLWFYLVGIVASGLVWLVSALAWLPAAQGTFVVGASGGVTATFILFVLYHPRDTVYFWGVFAMPAWVIGVVVIGLDLVNGLTGNAQHVAWQAHIGGAAFAYLYARFGWRLSSFLSPHGGWQSRWKWPRRGVRLKIHTPDDGNDTLADEADRILDKLHRQGEQSLTGRERRILEQYSRRMREKRQS